MQCNCTVHGHLPNKSRVLGHAEEDSTLKVHVTFLHPPHPCNMPRQHAKTSHQKPFSVHLAEVMSPVSLLLEQQCYTSAIH
eukprot:4649969-Amphidinium_carterae.1